MRAYFFLAFFAAGFALQLVLHAAFFAAGFLVVFAMSFGSL